MKRILKYEIKMRGCFSLEMPNYAKILSVGVGEREVMPCIWIIAEPDNEKEVRNFEIVQTNHEFSLGKCDYIGTFQTTGCGGHVEGHLFEL
ncbi:MAG: hypothetical protein GY928_32155 [Colwellia sp.]|nr:hypothetical protein [Colwellia sp.]